MKKILFLILLPLIALSSCVTWHTDWALSHGYIKAEDCPKLTVPERTPLPHPKIPIFETIDKNGKPIPLTPEYLIEIILEQGATVEKFEYLVEIYEREYLNAGGVIAPNMTLEELKKEYMRRLSELEKIPVTGTTGETQPEVPLNQ